MSTIQILMLATILVYLIGMVAIGAVLAKDCLLYTSDAADEL